jgi:pilus assembly protein CpaB
MNVKKVAPLIIALVLGGIAFKMILNLVEKRGSNAITQALKHPQVVVAKRGVEAGASLSPDDLALGDVSTDTVPETVFTSLDQLVGRVTVVPLLQGQVITTTLLAPRGMAAGLQATVPVGMRAVTLEINEMTGVAGYLAPGCHVDVVQTLKDDKTGMPMARTLAQNVKITAIGMRHNPQDGDGGGRSITLLVTPQQAELLDLASSIGRPRFSLRGGDDLANVETKGVTFAELLGKRATREDEYASIPSTQPIVPAIPAAVPASSTTHPSASPDPENDQWTIEVIRGGTATEVKFALHRSDDQFSDTSHEAQQN